jgi:hypothetical protein
MTQMESFVWRYRKSYSFHDWSNSDQIQIKFKSNSNSNQIQMFAETIEEYMIQIDLMTDKTMI